MGNDQLSDPDLDRIYQEVKSLRGWQEKHSGEGDGTTHELISKRQGRIEKRVSQAEMRIYGFGIFGGIGTFVAAKWKDLFGG